VVRQDSGSVVWERAKAPEGNELPLATMACKSKKEHMKAYREVEHDNFADATIGMRNFLISCGWKALSDDILQANGFQLFMDNLGMGMVLHLKIFLEDNWLGKGPKNLRMDGFGGAAKYTVVADDSTVIFLFDNDNDARFCYVGALEGSRDEAFVTYTDPSVVHFSTDEKGTWNRLAKDGKTILTDGRNVHFSVAGMGPIHKLKHRDNYKRVDSLLPVGVYFNDPGHEHFAGYLKNTYSISKRCGGSGYRGEDQQYLYRNDADGSKKDAEPGICILMP